MPHLRLKCKPIITFFGNCYSNSKYENSRRGENQIAATANDFHRYLEAAAAHVAPELERVLRGWQEDAAEQSRGLLGAQLESLAPAVRGGKLLRGTLVRLGYELADGQDLDQTLAASAAFELLHAGLLVHDDIIDQSPVRRGQPSLHEALGGGHAGLSQALCLGDIGFFLAVRHLAESDLAEPLRSLVVARFSQTALDTIIGEMIDVRLSASSSPQLEEDVVVIQQLKTAGYTFVGPLTIGATIAGAPASMLEALTEYGQHLGQAFQIQDDIMGIFGEEAVTGKSASSDIEGNKNTLLIAYALSHSGAAGRRELIKTYGAGKLTSAQLAAVRRIFETSGALAYSQARAQEYAGLAKGVIGRITESETLQRVLAQLADFSVNRQR